MSVKVTDFVINADGVLMTPTIQIVHPKTPQEATRASLFMKNVSEDLIVITELMIFFLCTRHAQPFVAIITPEERRENKHVRFGYGIFKGDEILPIG